MPPDDPFAAELMPFRRGGIERWLTERIASDLADRGVGDGICANVDFPSPPRVVRDVLLAAGLERYSIVDPDGPDVIVYEPVDGVFVERSRHGAGTTVTLDVGPCELVLDPTDPSPEASPVPPLASQADVMPLDWVDADGAHAHSGDAPPQRVGVARSVQDRHIEGIDRFRAARGREGSTALRSRSDRAGAGR